MNRLDISISSVLVWSQTWEAAVLTACHLAPAAQTLLPKSNAHQRVFVKVPDIPLAVIHHSAVLVDACVIWPATVTELAAMMT